MKTSYFSKTKYDKLEKKKILVEFPDHTREGIFLKSQVSKPFKDQFQYKLIYRDSETCINEIFLTKKDLTYINETTIKSKNAPVWLHHKELKDEIWPNSYSKLENLLKECSKE